MPRPRKDKPRPAPTRPERTYSDEETRAALLAYVETGKFSTAGERCGIPWTTVQSWVRNPRWADDLVAIRHAHAREVRGRYASAAEDFAASIVKGRILADQRLAQIASAADAGEPIDGKELASLLRGLASSASDVARIGSVVEQPELMGQAPAIFRVSVERPASEE